MSDTALTPPVYTLTAKWRSALKLIHTASLSNSKVSRVQCTVQGVLWNPEHGWWHFPKLHTNAQTISQYSKVALRCWVHLAMPWCCVRACHQNPQHKIQGTYDRWEKTSLLCQRCLGATGSCIHALNREGTLRIWAGGGRYSHCRELESYGEKIYPDLNCLRTELEMSCVHLFQRLLPFQLGLRD
jgi:hypothetical protein